MLFFERVSMSCIELLVSSATSSSLLAETLPTRPGVPVPPLNGFSIHSHSSGLPLFRVRLYCSTKAIWIRSGAKISGLARDTTLIRESRIVVPPMSVTVAFERSRYLRRKKGGETGRKKERKEERETSLVSSRTASATRTVRTYCKDHTSHTTHHITLHRTHAGCPLFAKRSANRVQKATCRIVPRWIEHCKT